MDGNAPKAPPKGPPETPFLKWTRKPNGAAYCYFNRRGWPQVKLDTGPGAPPLAEQVAAILATRAPPAARPGDVDAALDDYLAGAEFAALAPATQRNYQQIAREFRRTLGPVLLGDVDADWLLSLKDAWAHRGYKAANDRLSFLANVLRRPTVRGDVPPGLFALVGRVRRPRSLPEPHPIWTEAEQAAVLEAAVAAQPGLARALALTRYAGARPVDAVALPETALRNGRIAWSAGKNRKVVDLLLDPALAAILAATPRRAVTIAYRHDGASWPDARAFEKALRAFLEPLAEAGVVRAGLTAYGLRHAFGVALAELGASDAELQEALGHLTPATAQRYRRQARARRLADQALGRVIDARPARDPKKLEQGDG